MTKKDLKEKAAKGEALTEVQQSILDSKFYSDDYELTPWEALTEAEQEAATIAQMNKRGEAMALKNQNQKTV
jgi:hypothetical protein